MPYAQIPMRSIGPILFTGSKLKGEVSVPLATFETTLWPSTNRGAKVSRESGGICTTLLSDNMVRSICIEAPDAAYANQVSQALSQHQAALAQAVEQSSRFAKLTDVTTHQVGKLLYVRLSIQPGDASGHNMVTKAADFLMQWLLKEFAELRYVSISGNQCTDKKVSAVNALLGRGKKVIAELTIPRSVCEKTLKTTPEALVEINQKKNLLGSISAGSLFSANAHFANILLATYLATGQDAANIVEGSQGITTAELQGDDLYFAVTVPNLIVGTVGNGKEIDFVQDNLKQMGCLDKRRAGENSQRLACIIAGAILCGELSLLSALTNPGELMRSHTLFEREHKAVKK